MIFPVEYRKGKWYEPWAVKTTLGWSLSCPLLKREVVQVAFTSHVAAEDVGLDAQVTIRFSIEAYAF